MTQQQTEGEQEDKTRMTTHKGTWTAMTPITHGSDENYGMEQRLRTLKMKTPNGVEDIPVISGNALRGQMRDLLSQHYLETLGVEVGDTLSNALYSGGALKKGTSNRKIKRKTIKAVRKNIPFISVLGTALESQMIRGKLSMGMLIPIASETEEYTGINSDMSVFERVDETYYTRVDDREGGRMEDEDKQQMKYVVQVFSPGTEFSHEFNLEDTTHLEQSAVYKGFELLEENPRIGGMKGKGHGKVKWDYDEGLGSGEAYDKWLKENQDSLREYIEGLDDDLS